MTSSNPSPYGTPAQAPDPLPVPPAATAPASPPDGISTDYTEPVIPDDVAGDDASVTDEESSAKNKAADTAAAGKQAAGEVAQTAVGKAQDVAQEAKAQVRNLAGQAQDQLRDQAGTQHRHLVTNLRALGDELASMADNSEKSGPATDLVGEAGARAHSTASWLDDREPGQLVDELRSFARRKPGVFVLGALAAGVLAGRLTRGVVAAHQDDSDGDDNLTAGSSSDEVERSRHRAVSTSDAGTVDTGAAGIRSLDTGALETGAFGTDVGGPGPAVEAAPAAAFDEGRGPLGEVRP
jgi:hypothetical protein